MKTCVYRSHGSCSTLGLTSTHHHVGLYASFVANTRGIGMFLLSAGKRDHFSSVKMVSMRSEKPICTPLCLSFPNSAFETVPVFV